MGAAVRGIALIKRGGHFLVPGSISPAPARTDINIYAWPPAVAVVGPISIRPVVAGAVIGVAIVAAAIGAAISTTSVPSIIANLSWRIPRRIAREASQISQRRCLSFPDSAAGYNDQCSRGERNEQL
jgi:hypothetical protein